MKGESNQGSERAEKGERVLRELKEKGTVDK